MLGFEEEGREEKREDSRVDEGLGEVEVLGPGVTSQHDLGRARKGIKSGREVDSGQRERKREDSRQQLPS